MARCRRDYDPTVGRFTAPDPAKDPRGDGDLYDYCVDDPVSCVDPAGLWTQHNFSEARIIRDDLGRFSSGIDDLSGDNGTRHDTHGVRVGGAERERNEAKNEANFLQQIATLWAPDGTPEYKYATGSLQGPLKAFGRGMSGIDGPSIDPYIEGLRFVSPEFKKDYDEAMENARKKWK